MGATWIVLTLHLTTAAQGATAATGETAATGATAAPATVLPFPVKTDGVSAAVAEELQRVLAGDLQARAGVRVPSDADRGMLVAGALGDQLDACRGDVACLGGVADAAGADYVLVTQVLARGVVWDVNTRLHAAETGTLVAAIDRKVEGEDVVRVQQVRLTAASLVTRFSPGGSGQLRLNLVEDDVQLSIDGEARGEASDAPLTVPAGAHYVELSREGFLPFRVAIEVPVGGQVVVDATVRPTEAWLDDYTFWAWTLNGTALTLLGVGLVGLVAGGGIVGASAGLVLFTDQAVQAHNADPNRTAEARDQLQLQTTAGYAGYVVGALVAALSVLPLLAAPVVFVVADNPLRYDE